jgi:putative heme-binding domain-containing protein
MKKALALAALLVAPSLDAQDAATPVERIRVKAGFKVELLYSVPREKQGSWVSLCVDGKGRLIASDQDGKLYRITVGAAAADTRVEPLDVAIGMAHGLLWAFDSLYVMVNGSAAKGSGLYRVRDTDGDDKFDEVKLLRNLKGGGEHGPHGIVLSPDGKSLTVVCGNHTDLPPFEATRVPKVWQEDQLLPRMPDGHGHARDRMAPGGYMFKVDPEGTTWELLSVGYRNTYDIAYHRDGELFGFDSDMEWDMNMPWYRPTRVGHAVSGSEFGWRNGSGKWPAYYPDSLPAAVDIGPGSPTGICFGYGAKFPAFYQDALYLCDWSYGKLYAVHLEPRGASYGGTFEEFASAQPLPLTDVVVHPDGALYFTIGGRKVQSGLYRITYTGQESTAPVKASDHRPSPAAEARRKLEAFHGHADPTAVDAAWPHLGDADRFVRFAARTALEFQDPASWQDRALSEKNAASSLTALLGLARVGDKSLQPRLLEALDRLDWAKLTDAQRLDLMRVTGLAFIRMGKPDAATAARVARKFDAHYPAGSPSLNAELARLLAYLDAPAFVEKTLALLPKGLTQEEQIHYLYCFRAAKSGWTPELRKKLIGEFDRVLGFRGGHSFEPFIRNIRKEWIDATFTEEEKKELAPLLAAKPALKPVGSAAPPRPFVRKWAVADLAGDVEKGLKARKFENGRAMFAAAGCTVCHRVALDGGAFGPDLTGAGGRFSLRDLLESIIEPSKVISDQYASVKIALKDGNVVAGRIINLNGDNLMVNTDMRDPDAITGVKRGNVERIVPSEASMMPEGLLDTLEKNDIMDLMAFLISGGNPDHAAFR